jgi:mono/diheme cytochrome c family protein
MKLYFPLSIFVVLVFSSCGSKSAAGSSASQVNVQPLAMNSSLAAGKDLYENNCANCHGLYKATDFTKEAWAPILVEMGKKARLDETQMASISNYIYSQL